MYDMILIRYGEMTLKKKNYKTFLNQMNQNIQKKCSKFKKLTFFHTSYRFYIYLNGEDEKEVIECLNQIVGLSSYSLCVRTESQIEKIALKAISILEEEKSKRTSFSFKVETHRGDKSFPLTSIEISQQVAKLILPQVEGLTVDVHHPEVTLHIDLRSEGTYLYTNEIPGLGGYPSGMAGKGVVMMSGGIDSPVAAFLCIRKGVNISFMHFASPPYTSDLALQKVIDLTEQLTSYTSDGLLNLYVVPFTQIQTIIHECADASYLVTLMRRAMYKIADTFVREHKMDCIINGESIGQVASQTLEGMKVVNDVTTLPIIRPLSTFDKEEVIQIAKKIETFDISIRPYEDCCTVFVPTHPVIKPKIENVLEEEKKCEGLEDAIRDALNQIVLYTLEDGKHFNLFEQDKIGKFDV